MAKPGQVKIKGKCTACKAGTFSKTGGSCLKCTGNSISIKGASSCNPCTAEPGVCFNPIANAAKTACGAFLAISNISFSASFKNAKCPFYVICKKLYGGNCGNGIFILLAYGLEICRSVMCLHSVRSSTESINLRKNFLFCSPALCTKRQTGV